MTVLELKTLLLLWQITQLSVASHKRISSPNRGCYGSGRIFRARISKVFSKGSESKYFKHCRQGAILSKCSCWKDKGHFLIYFTFQCKKQNKPFLANGPWKSRLQVLFCSWVLVLWPLLLDNSPPCAGSASQATYILWLPYKNTWFCHHYWQ